MSKVDIDCESRLFDVDFSDASFRRNARGIRIPRPRSALDEAREMGGWTLDKLELLTFYFRMYRRIAGGGTYIDGYAGTGMVSVQGKRKPSSASIALQSGAFKELYFFEKPQRAKQLTTYLERTFKKRDFAHCHVQSGDFNVEILPLLESGVIARDKACFAFLDPNSTQLDWSTVKALSEYKGDRIGELKIEMWILLNTHQALVRLMPKAPRKGYATSPSAITLDRVMGGREAWWDVFEGSRTPHALARRYVERLHEVLGYGAARPYLVRDPATGRPHYYMIQASDHRAAFSLMQWAERQTLKDAVPNVPMFKMSVGTI